MTSTDQVRTNTRNAQLESLLPILEPGPVIETSTKGPIVPNLLPILEPGPVIETAKKIPVVSNILPILEPGPVIETAKKIPVVSNHLPILEPGPVIIRPTTNLGMSRTAIPRTPAEARNIQLGGQIATQGADLVKDTVAKVPAVPKTPINPYKPLMANNNAFMNPSMSNLGLGIGISRQATNEARNAQVKGQSPILEPGPVIETTTRVPVVPNQHNIYGTHIVPSSNDFMLTNLGISKAVIPRTSTNGARNIQVEGQASDLVKDSVTKVAGVPKNPINPYKPLMANNNAFMNPSMANIGLGLGVSRQANGAGMPMPSQRFNGAGMPMPSQRFNGAGMPMPSQRFNGAVMPKMAHGQWSGSPVGVSDEMPMMWQNTRKTSRTNDW
uniref:SFRICE_035010 n=1 Tax=Spodoptera frugiperda TaxID=7108 RepID=A0A2H1X146_SPOFR